MMNVRVFAVAAYLFAGAVVEARSDGVSGSAKSASAGTPAVSWLSQWMDQFHSSLYVYSDFCAGGNHFSVRGLLSEPQAAGANVPPMNEAYAVQPYSGDTCIEASVRLSSPDLTYGGWYFLNGVLPGGQSEPQANWGEVAEAGVALTGAKRLRFRARGQKGGERVAFFLAGIGWDPDTQEQVAAHPDSSPKRTTGYLTLTSSWKEYTIDLAGKDMSYVLCGFGWVASVGENGRKDIVFYLDDIRYELARTDEPRLLLSYRTQLGSNDFDLVTRNVAYTYDNAVASIALLAAGETNRALLIADAFVYALGHDRHYTDGRLRNAYQAGDLALPPGWFGANGLPGTVRLPGWYGAANGWLESRVHVGITAGNQAWAALALLNAYEATGKAEYLEAARAMGAWLEASCRDERGAGGYTGGYEGWEPLPTKVLYKSTEHVIDVFAVFSWLARLLPAEARWAAGAEHARAFVDAMYDPASGRFRTGTADDGVTLSEEVTSLDCQVWPALAMGTNAASRLTALAYAGSRLRVGGGFAFSEEHASGVWTEGTAFTALADAFAGDAGGERDVFDYLVSIRDASGGFYATDIPALETGISQTDGTLWIYYRRLHVAPAAWFVLAAQRFNPFSGVRLDASGEVTNVWEGPAGVAASLTLPDAFAGAAKVTVKGLPAGLKYNSATRLIEGAPARAGTYTVVISAAGVDPQTLVISVAALPAWAQGTFNGYAGGGGLASMSVTAAGKVTGKVTAGGTNYTFAATSYERYDADTATYWIETQAKAGKALKPLAIGVLRPVGIDQWLGYFIPENVAAAESENEWLLNGRGGGVPLLMWRDVWKEAPETLALFSGYYTVVLPGNGAYGSGYLTLTVDRSGKVKAAGKLADGTAVSMGGALLINGSGLVSAALYAMPAAYEGGMFFGEVGFVKPFDGEAFSGEVTLTCRDPVRWESLNPRATAVYGAGFERPLPLSGGWYSKTENLYGYYQGLDLAAGADTNAPAPELTVGATRYASAWWSPTGVALTPAASASGVMTGLTAPAAGKPTDADGDGAWDYAAENSVGLKISLARPTGIFKGTFLCWFDYPEKKHVSKSVAFEGVLTPVRENPADGVEGRGFFLWADKATVPATGKAYPFKWSYDFEVLRQ